MSLQVLKIKSIGVTFVPWYSNLQSETPSSFGTWQYTERLHQITEMGRTEPVLTLGRWISCLVSPNRHWLNSIKMMWLEQSPHVSLYGLTYKEGTPLHTALHQWEVTSSDEDIWIEQLTASHQDLNRPDTYGTKSRTFANLPIKHNTTKGSGKINTIWGWGLDLTDFGPTVCELVTLQHGKIGQRVQPQ